MKTIKVRTDYPHGEDITPGKIYTGTLSSTGKAVHLVNDNGDKIYTLLEGSAHLNNNSWEVVDE